MGTTIVQEAAPSGDILYQNSKKELDKVPGLLVRRYSAHVCFVNEEYPGMGSIPEGYDAIGGVSLSDLLPKYLGTDLGQIILMRVQRLYVDDADVDDACGLLEFTYAYRSEIPKK